MAATLRIRGLNMGNDQNWYLSSLSFFLSPLSSLFLFFFFFFSSFFVFFIFLKRIKMLTFV